MCFSCLRYGHVSADCKGKPRCAQCGNLKHPTQEECPRFHLPPICCNCKGEHVLSSPACPTYNRYKQIYAYATIENVSYAEAYQRLGVSSSPNSLPPNPFLHQDFPSLSRSSPSPSPSRIPPSYNDLVLQDTVGNPPEFADPRHNHSRSYADAACAATHNGSVHARVSKNTNSHGLPPDGPRHVNNNLYSDISRPKVRHQSNSYNRLREAHNSSLLEPTNG